MVFENDTKTDRRKRIENNNQYLGLGKLPPQATDLEEVILGGIMIAPVPINVWATLKPDFFYKENHRMIYKAILELHNERSAIDTLTVKSRIQKNGELELCGGSYALMILSERVASTANIEYHIAIIHQKFLQRELIRIGGECINNMYEDTNDPLRQMTDLLRQISELERGIFKRTEKNSSELIDEIVEDINNPKKYGMLGYTTGIKGIDHVTRGDQKGSLRVVAAATSVGKTIELCSEVLNSCFDENKDLLKEQIPTAVFSLEMPSKQLTYRLVSNLSSIDNTAIKTANLNPEERQRLKHYFAEFRKAKIFIDDTPGLSINEFEAKAAMLASTGIKKIYIDYYQLMKGDPNKKYGTREQELSDISRRLKICAKEFDLAIILLAQIGQEVEKRPLCIPVLGDLRECKALAHDADVVMFIWRPEYYENVLKELIEKGQNIFCKLFDINIEDFENMCFLVVAKNRDGELGKIPLKFSGKIMRISDHLLVSDRLQQYKDAGANQIFNNLEKTAPF